MLFSTNSVDILTNPTTLCIIILIILVLITFRQGEYSTKALLINKEGEYLNNEKVCEITELDKESLIDILTEELPALRAKLGLSQDELSNIIGISRQTYNAIETKKRKMSWNTFLSLILLYGYNDKTTVFLENVGAFPASLKSVLNIDKRSKEN